MAYFELNASLELKCLILS